MDAFEPPRAEVAAPAHVEEPGGNQLLWVDLVWDTFADLWRSGWRYLLAAMGLYGVILAVVTVTSLLQEQLLLPAWVWPGLVGMFGGPAYTMWSLSDPLWIVATFGVLFALAGPFHGSLVRAIARHQRTGRGLGLFSVFSTAHRGWVACALLCGVLGPASMFAFAMCLLPALIPVAALGQAIHFAVQHDLPLGMALRRHVSHLWAHPRIHIFLAVLSVVTKWIVMVVAMFAFVPLGMLFGVEGIQGPGISPRDEMMLWTWGLFSGGVLAAGFMFGVSLRVRAHRVLFGDQPAR